MKKNKFNLDTRRNVYYSNVSLGDLKEGSVVEKDHHAEKEVVLRNEQFRLETIYFNSLHNLLIKRTYMKTEDKELFPEKFNLIKKENLAYEELKQKYLNTVERSLGEETQTKLKELGVI